MNYSTRSSAISFNDIDYVCGESPWFLISNKWIDLALEVSLSLLHSDLKFDFDPINPWTNTKFSDELLNSLT